MKLHLILAMAAFCIAPSLTFAQRGPGGDGFDRGRGGPGGDWANIWTDPERREEMYERLKERVGEERAAEIRERMEAEYTRRFDTNGDGEVTEVERTEVMQKWQQEREQRAQEWQERREIARWDEDRDGKLSEEELAKKEAYEKEQAEQLKAKTEAMVKEFDTDKDGELSPEEIKAMREKVEAMLTKINDIATVAGAKARNGDNQYEGIVRSIDEARRGNRGGFQRGGPQTAGREDGPPPAEGDGPPPPPRPRRPGSALTGE